MEYMHHSAGVNQAVSLDKSVFDFTKRIIFCCLTLKNQAFPFFTLVSDILCHYSSLHMLVKISVTYGTRNGASIDF